MLRKKPRSRDFVTYNGQNEEWNGYSYIYVGTVKMHCFPQFRYGNKDAAEFMEGIIINYGENGNNRSQYGMQQ